MVYDTETERYVPKWRLEEYPGINRDFKLLYYSRNGNNIESWTLKETMQQNGLAF